MIVLPIMFYHQLQLFVCSIMAGRFASRFDAAPAADRRSVADIVAENPLVDQKNAVLADR